MVPGAAPGGVIPASTPAPIKGDATALPAIDGANPSPANKATSPDPVIAPATAPKSTKPEFDFHAKVNGDTAASS